MCFRRLLDVGDEERDQEDMAVEEGPQGTGDETPQEERDRYLRLVAEFDNYRKRTERDMVEFKRRAADHVLLALLEVIDNLDRALEAEDDSSSEGLSAIRRQMDAILQREGIEAIDAVGRPFDPFEMEAVMRMPSDDAGEGDVLRELQRGYRGNGYVLRPSKVIVSAGPPQEAAPGGEGSVTDSSDNEK